MEDQQKGTPRLAWEREHRLCAATGTMALTPQPPEVWARGNREGVVDGNPGHAVEGLPAGTGARAAGSEETSNS